MSDPLEYTSHNFDAVNNQIQEIADRERSRSFAYRLQSYKWLALYGLAITLAIILFFYFSSLIYRNLNAPYPLQETKVIKPEIIEREVIKVIKIPTESNLTSASETNTAYEGPNNSEIKTSAESSFSNSGRNVVKKFTTFRTLSTSEFLAHGFSEITTGWSYKDSESKFPDSQYCYILKNNSSGSSTSVHVQLANIDPKGNLINDVNSNSAREAGILQSVLNKAMKKCQWASL